MDLNSHMFRIQLPGDLLLWICIYFFNIH